MRRFLLAGSILLAAGCSEDGPLTEVAAGSPLLLDGALAYLDASTSSLVIVDPAGEAGPRRRRKLSRIQVGETPVLARSVPYPDDPARHRVLVVDPGGEQVVLVQDKSGATVPLDVGVPLEALDVSSDGHWAIAYQPDGATPTRSLFAFPNTVAVLDLTTPKATALRLGSSGARPLRAVFAESVRLSNTVSVAGEPTQVTAEVPLALVFVQGGIVPLDLAKGVAGSVVPVTPDADHEVVPAEVLFTNNESDLLSGRLDNIERAFVRTTDGELYVLAISLSSASGANDPSSMDVSVALENIVTPDAYVEDVELYFDDDGRELLLAAAGRELILVDGYTGVATRFAQEQDVDTLVRFTDPTDGRDLALAYSRTTPNSSLLRLDPFGLDQRRSTGVEALHLGARIVSVDVAGDSSRAVLEYDDGRDLGVLDLTRSGDVLDLRFARRLQTRRLSPGGSRLWLVSISPEDDAPHFAEVELGASLATRDVRLDGNGASVGSAGKYLFVDHGDPTGSVTFFPDDDLRRESAIAFTGVIYADLLTVDPPARAVGEEE